MLVLPYFAVACCLLHAVDSASSYRGIIGGKPVRDGDFPFAVSVTMDHIDGQGICGGAIVSNTAVVTAAHCVTDPETGEIAAPQNLRIGFGSSSRSRQLIISAESVHIHPQYNAVNVANDIAIITVPVLAQYMTPGKQSYQGVPFSPQRIPIYAGDIPEGTRLTAIGWGQTGTDPSVDSTSDLLNSAERVVGSNRACSAFISSYESANGPQICTDNRLNLGQDSCQGDSGGAVLIEVKGQHYLAGIISYGSNKAGDPTCALPDGFSINTHVDYYLPFITDVTGQPETSLRSRSLH